MKNKVGHTSSTILNSCSFQRYRLPFQNLYSILVNQTLSEVNDGWSMVKKLFATNVTHICSFDQLVMSQILGVKMRWGGKISARILQLLFATVLQNV